MRKRFGQTIREYMRENQSLYVFTSVLFAMGVIFGSLIVGSLPPSQNQELLGFLQYFFSNIKEHGGTDTTLHFQQALGYYIRVIAMMWIFGLSIIGVPVILLLLFMKGTVVGFTVGFLVQQFQWDGVTFSLMGVLPQNMLVVPALMIAGVAGVSFSLRLVRTRLVSKRGEVFPYFVSYTFLSAAMFGVLVIAALFETFVSPQLMQLALK